MSGHDAFLIPVNPRQLLIVLGSGLCVNGLLRASVCEPVLGGESRDGLPGEVIGSFPDMRISSNAFVSKSSEMLERLERVVARANAKASLGAFSGSLDASYESQISNLQRSDEIVVHLTCKVATRWDSCALPLTPDVFHQSSKDFVAAHGTHFAKRALKGGSFEAFLHYSLRSNESTEDAKKRIEAKISYFCASGGGSVEHSNRLREEFSETISSTYYSSLGAVTFNPHSIDEFITAYKNFPSKVHESGGNVIEVEAHPYTWLSVGGTRFAYSRFREGLDWDRLHDLDDDSIRATNNLLNARNSIASYRDQATQHGLFVWPISRAEVTTEEHARLIEVASDIAAEIERLRIAFERSRPGPEGGVRFLRDIMEARYLPAVLPVLKDPQVPVPDATQVHNLVEENDNKAQLHLHGGEPQYGMLHPHFRKAIEKILEPSLETLRELKASSNPLVLGRGSL